MKSTTQGDLDKSSVRVLAEQKVGGFHTTILEADRTDELSDWLKKNGYSNDPELQSWLAPYVAARWKITAFKVSQDPKTGMLAATKPVRMSFKTERPFFPYREPEGKAPKANTPADKEKAELAQKNADEMLKTGRGRRRLLRVFFVSDARMEGKLGGAAWQARVPWADQLTDEQRKQIITETGLADGDVPAKVWMTTFEDRASPRPGKEEVYFSPAENQTPVRPRDDVHYKNVWIPADCVLLSVGFVALIVGVIWRMRRAGSNPGLAGGTNT
jgi:hypothetical protein